METFRRTERWLHWGFSLVAAGLLWGSFLVVGSSLLLPEQWGAGIRIVIPLFALVAWWLLAAAVNFRTITINPNGLFISVWPFPVQWPRRFPRTSLRCCYCREIPNQTADGAPAAAFYMSGVESTSGFQLDLNGPFSSRDQAISSAQKISQFLNSGTTAAPIPVEQRPYTLYAPGTLRRFLIWLAAFLIAIAIGAAWEISRH